MTAPPPDVIAPGVVTRIITVANQKGGVGKTADADGLAGALAEMGFNVLLVDMDPQGHLTASALRLPRAASGENAANLYRALTGKFDGPLAELIVTHSEPAGRLDVIPSAYDMVNAAEAVSMVKAREHRLARLLRAARGIYHFVIIDAPPALDVLMDNCLVAANGIVIPVQAEDSSMEALSLLFPQITAVERELRDKPLQMHGTVVNLLRRPPGILARGVLKELEALEGLPILGTIPLSVVITESWRYGKTPTTYAPDSEIAQEFRNIAQAVSR